MQTKIAVPARNGQIDTHFGHCEYFQVYEVKDGDILSEKTVPSPNGCGCKSNIAAILAQDGVSLMIAGNMGQGAVQTLQTYGINVVRGAAGSTTEAVQSWISGQLNDSGTICHEHQGNCSH